MICPRFQMRFKATIIMTGCSYLFCNNNNNNNQNVILIIYGQHKEVICMQMKEESDGGETFMTVYCPSQYSGLKQRQHSFQSGFDSYTTCGKTLLPIAGCGNDHLKQQKNKANHNNKPHLSRL